VKIEQIETRASVGHMLCHDITKIERGAFKGARFKKGHKIKAEDIDVLLDLGKNNIYVLELEDGDLHEDEAGERIARALAGPGLELSAPSEGRINLTAKQAGLLKIDVERLQRINSIPDVVVSTLHTYSPVQAGDLVTGAKVIPLVVNELTVKAVEKICLSAERPIRILPYKPFKIGVLITGREVFEGRIKDGFAPVLTDKAARYGLEEPTVNYAPDDASQIADSINRMLEEGCNMVIVTGGMSVDPDDVTPTGIKNSGAEIVKYGAPALPGAMFLLAYKDQVPVIGLPACAMYFQNTVLDIIMPRLLAGQTVSASDIAALGHGGLCRQCETCTFPNCSFGKGGL
jgi:molybdopterin biosynthesis enzyme